MPKTVAKKFSKLMQECRDYKTGVDPVFNLNDTVQTKERAEVLISQLNLLKNHNLAWLQEYRINLEKRELQKFIDGCSGNIGDKYIPLVFQKP